MPIDDKEMCPCGKPLHYQDRDKRRNVDELIARLGLEVPVTCEGRTWLVSRHYIALHSFDASELPVLAKKYSFKEVTNVSKPK
jgi:hypothetical protein